MKHKLLSLDGLWHFSKAGSSALYPANVPGCVHTDLHAAGLIADPFWGSNELKLQWIEKTDWQYTKSFNIPQVSLQEEYIELVALGVDTTSSISINDTVIGTTENMFSEYRFQIKQYLREGDNRISVTFKNPMSYIDEKRKNHSFEEWNDPVGGASNIRKQQCSFGWDWGPRLVTCGIYKSMYIHAWSNNRIESVLIKQMHASDKVTLQIEPQLALPDSHGLTLRYSASLNDEIIATSESSLLTIDNPQLWWPNGLGDHPLYNISVELIDKNKLLDSKTIRTGLRIIQLDHHQDQWGETFQFIVNGIPVFAKGANWIPANIFVTGSSPSSYQKLLRSAAEANMNMLRIWGGGIYEMDIFYELCDSLGIMVWQDFMFACSLYPADDHFLSLVKNETATQIKRLRNHACLALWCGNNEIEQIPELKIEQYKEGYKKLFYTLLKNQVTELSPHIVYWPSSPHNPYNFEMDDPNNEESGDAHFWEVWHQRKPVKQYEKKQFRFCSEFGMQSLCSEDTASKFTNDLNIFAPDMESHQKHPDGNMIMLEYIFRLYRFPKNYSSLAYLSQLNQAYCMKIAVEHFRRNMPRTMGALYWQLNDCWPVASWSGIEFGGKWKALHYHARRFFAPVLLSAKIYGEEYPGKANRLTNSISRIDLYTVSDLVEIKQAKLRWELFNLSNQILQSGCKETTLKYGESTKQVTLDFSDIMEKFDRRSLYLRIYLQSENDILSEDTVFFTSPRFMDFNKEKIRYSVEIEDTDTLQVTLHPVAFHHQVVCQLKNISFKASDNYFDLYPGIPRTITVITDKPIGYDDFLRNFDVTSLTDSY